jgi:hypothetical protein
MKLPCNMSGLEDRSCCPESKTYRNACIPLARTLVDSQSFSLRSCIYRCVDLLGAGADPSRPASPISFHDVEGMLDWCNRSERCTLSSVWAGDGSHVLAPRTTTTDYGSSSRKAHASGWTQALHVMVDKNMTTCPRNKS